MQSKILSYGKTLPGSGQQVKQGKYLIFAAMEELGSPCAFSTQSFADTHDPNLHRFVIQFAGLAGTNRDSFELGISDREAYKRRAANLANYPAVVVWYWKERTLHFRDHIKIKVLGFTHIIGRAEFQARGSEHEHALEFHPNKPPDYHLDLIAGAAFAVVKSRGGGSEAFDLREVAQLATNLASGLVKPGDAAFGSIQRLLESSCAQDPHGVSATELMDALHQCAGASAWYDRMICAENMLWDAHGADFVPSGQHPCQVDPHLLGPAEVPGDYDRLERDYYNLRHCTCRHSDCTGDYCRRVRKRPDGSEETFCRFEEKLQVRYKPGEGPDGKKRSMPTHFYAEATAKKGDEVPADGSMADGVLRWRLYVAKDDPRINTTHPTQTRGARANNDFCAAIDKYGLVNYVTKAAHYISKQEKPSDAARNILEVVAKGKDYEVESSVRTLLFQSISRDTCAQEINGIALGYGPYRTNIIQVNLRWIGDVRVVQHSKGPNGKPGGARSRFNDMEVYWNRTVIMQAQVVAMAAQQQSPADLCLYAKCIGYSNEMSAAEFQRHFSTFPLDCGEASNETDCWRIHRRDYPSLTAVVIKPQLPDSFRRLPAEHQDHERFCRMRLTTHMAVRDAAELAAYVDAHGGTFAAAYRAFMIEIIARDKHPDFDRKGRVVLMDQVAFDGAEMADDVESRPAHQPEHHYDDDMDGGSGERFSNPVDPDTSQCPSSSAVESGYWDAHRMSFDLQGVPDQEVARDWVLQQKTTPEVTLQARDDKPVPLQQLNAEQQFAVSLLLDWYRAWAAQKFDGRQGPLPPPVRMIAYGCAGVGKSEVLKATCAQIDADLDCRRAARLAAGGAIDGLFLLTSADLVLVAAPTGAAAVSVGGQTVHALTALSSRANDDGNGSKNFENLATGGQALKRLQARFQHAIFVFQDEIGMTDASMFGKQDTRISQAKITEANPNPGPFGGCNIILFGHHAQLPPVTGDRLFSASSKDKRDLCAIKGRASYNLFTTVVVLREQMRQRSAATTPEK